MTINEFIQLTVDTVDANAPIYIKISGREIPLSDVVVVKRDNLTKGRSETDLILYPAEND